jgi:hypothetical protein
VTDAPILGQLLLLSSTRAAAVPYVTAAEKLGVSWLLGAEPDDATSDSTTLQTTMSLHFAQRDAVLDVVQYAMEHPLAAVVALDERCAPCRARSASMMGMPGNPPKAADACLDKFALRQKLSNVGLRTPVLGDAPAGRDLQLAAILDGSRMRVLGVIDENLALSEAPRPALEAVARAARTVGLSYGPLWAQLRLSGEEVWLLDLAPALPIDHFNNLQFRIPLVDEEISLPEFILRHALSMDISRVYSKK